MKLISRSAGFLRGVREELRQVTWPTRQELAGSTLVVFVGAGILALYIMVVDSGLSGAARMLLR